jgi:hypothetical protein
MIKTDRAGDVFPAAGLEFESLDPAVAGLELGCPLAKAFGVGIWNFQRPALAMFFSQDTRNAAPKYVSFLVRGFK